MAQRPTYANISGGTSVPTGRTATVTASGITPVTGAEVVTVRGGRYLRLARRTTFPEARSLTPATTPEVGWTKVNGSALTTIDENTTAADALYLRHGASSTDWYSGSATYTAPLRYRTLTLQPGRPVTACARIGGNNQANFESCGLIVEGPANGSYVRAGIQFNTTLKVWSSYGTTEATAALTTGQRDAGIWVAIVIERNSDDTYSWSTYYSVAAVSTPPLLSSMTKLQSRSSVAQWTAPALRVGILQITANTNDTLENEVHWFEVVADHDDYTLLPWEEAAQWAAVQYDDAATEQAIVTDYDLGTDAPTLDQAQLRLILADLVNRLPNDSGTVTFSCVQSSGAGAASSAYNAAGTAVVEGSGRYLNLWAKLGAGLDAGASIGPFPFALPVS